MPISAKSWAADAGGAWNTAADWTPSSVPTASDAVALPAFSTPYTVTLTGAAGAAQSLAVGGPATLSLATDSLSIATNVYNAGTLNLVNSGLFAQTMTNAGGGTIALGSDSGISMTLGFVNDGDLTSTAAGMGTNVVAGPVTNAGTVGVAAGFLDFTSGLGDSGSISLASGAGLELDGGTSTIAGSISGAGAMFIIDGTVAIDAGVSLGPALDITGGSATFATGASLAAAQLILAGGTATIATELPYAGSYEQAGGTLDLASGAALMLTGTGITGFFEAGTITGSGVLLNKGQFDIAGGTITGSAILRNGQTGTIHQLGNLALAGSAIVENHAGGVYDVTSSSILATGSGTSVINAGSFVALSGTDTIAAGFTNDSGGTLTVAAGTLLFTGGLNDSGSVSIADGTTLNLDGGSSTIAGSIAGGGYVDIAGGNVTFAAGASITAAKLGLFGGTGTIATDLTYGGYYDQGGGTLDLAGGAALILTGSTANAFGPGTIAGSGVLLNKGLLDIYGGDVAGSAILRNGMTGTIIQTGNLTLAGAAIAESHAGGVYDLDNASILSSGTGTSFVNAGSFVSNSSGTNTVAAAFTNMSGGTLAVGTDIIEFTGGLDDEGSVSIGGVATLKLDGGSSTIAGTVSGGTTSALAIAGGTVTFTAGASFGGRQFYLSGGTATIATDLTLTGRTFYSQDGGTLDLASGAALILAAGTSTSLTAGTIAGGGVLLNKSSFFIQGGELAGGAILRNGMTGTIVQDGTLTLAGAAIVENHAGGIYDLADNSDILSSGPDTSFINAGSFFSSSGTNSVGTPFTNDSGATLTVAAGTLVFTGGLSNSGSIVIASGAELVLDGGTGTIAGSILGGGVLEIAGGSVTFAAGASIAAAGEFALFGGTAVLAAATDLTYAGFYDQAGGTLDLASGAALILPGTGNTDVFDAGTIVGSGVLLTQGQFAIAGGDIAGSAILRTGATGTIAQTGDLTLAGAAMVENHAGGAYELEGGANILSSGSGTSFINGGSFVSSGGINTVAAGFTNDSGGTVTGQSGTLDLTGAVTNSGEIWADTGNVSIAGTLSGTGTDTIGAGETLTFGGNVASGQAVSFAAASGTLALGQAQSFAGTMADFGAGNAIDLTNFASPGATITGVTATLLPGGSMYSDKVTVQDGLQTASLDLLVQTAAQSSYNSTADYSLTPDTNTPTGTLFQLAPA